MANSSYRSPQIVSARTRISDSQGGHDPRNSFEQLNVRDRSRVMDKRLAEIEEKRKAVQAIQQEQARRMQQMTSNRQGQPSSPPVSARTRISQSQDGGHDPRNSFEQLRVRDRSKRMDQRIMEQQQAEEAEMNVYGPQNRPAVLRLRQEYQPIQNRQQTMRQQTNPQPSQPPSPPVSRRTRISQSQDAGHDPRTSFEQLRVMDRSKRMDQRILERQQAEEAEMNPYGPRNRPAMRLRSEFQPIERNQERRTSINRLPMPEAPINIQQRTRRWQEQATPNSVQRVNQPVYGPLNRIAYDRLEAFEQPRNAQDLNESQMEHRPRMRLRNDFRRASIIEREQQQQQQQQLHEMRQQQIRQQQQQQLQQQRQQQRNGSSPLPKPRSRMMGHPTPATRQNVQGYGNENNQRRNQDQNNYAHPRTPNESFDRGEPQRQATANESRRNSQAQRNSIDRQQRSQPEQDRRLLNQPKPFLGKAPTVRLNSFGAY